MKKERGWEEREEVEGVKRRRDKGKGKRVRTERENGEEKNRLLRIVVSNRSDNGRKKKEN